ncbi:host specificity factor TipJ family phage tail protein [Hydrogenimonas urashimensis]|uniref:host specificity factor TipJ family phage tail protein n=1 Tax=Hydrogenimonas urashimensis TaxID=2740515 RepID=UPI0019151C19|nr:host specificity factor TipJ family phage tail protein [Hydrogenimonas urashimensis]
MVCITEIRNPFDPVNSRVTTFKEPGKTLAEYISPFADVVVAVDGEITTKYDMVLTGDRQIIVSPVLRGGGGGKDILRAVAFVALAVVAPYAADVAFLAMGAETAAALGNVGYYTIMAATVAGGAMLINAVLPPQIPSFGQIGSSSLESSPVYGWSGTRTLPTPGSPIPVLFGQMRLPGSVIGQYIKDEGDDEYLYTLLALCEGEIEPIWAGDILINNNPLDTYDNVEYAYRQGTLSQTNTADEMAFEKWHDGKTIGWFDKVDTANAFSAELTYDNTVEKITLGNAVDSITISVTMPQGLFYVNDKGGLDSRTVKFKIEYSSDGTNWTLHQRVYPEYTETEYEWRRYNLTAYDYEYQWSASSPGSGWSKSGKSRKRVVGERVYDYFAIDAAKTSAIRRQFTITGLTPGQYHVRLTKLSEDKETTRERNTLYWSGMTEMTSDRLYYPSIALLAIRIKANGQLSGSAPSINTLVRRGGIEVFDENGTSQGVKRSDNPAWVAWDVITNRKHGMGKPYSAVDFARFAEWAEWCDQAVPDGFGGEEPRAKFNGVLDFQSNMWETLQKICSVGRAAPVMVGTKYSVIIDKPADPVQLFSMGNIVKGSYKTRYIGKNDVATEIDIEYVDSKAGYGKNAVTVSLGDNTGAKTTLSLIGCTDQSQAYRHGRYMLQCNDKQRRVVEFEAGIDSIACQPGDVIMFAHDVPAWGYSGRVASGTTDTVTLDRSVDIDVAKSYRVVVRHQDDTIEERDVQNPGDGSFDTFTVVTDFDAAPSKFDIYTFGEVNKEYIELRVAAITRKSDQTRKITAIDYNDTILDDWTTPDNIARPSHITGFAEITDISIGEHLEKRSDGTIVPFIDFAWRVADDRMAIVDLLISPDGGTTWNDAQTGIRGGEYRMNAIDLEEGREYTFAFVVNDISGRQPVSEAAKASHAYLGKSAPPDDITNVSYTVDSSAGIILSWDESDDVDLAGYNIYKNGSPFRKMVTTNIYECGTISGQTEFGVTAVDTSGNESESMAVITVDYSAIEAPEVHGYIDDTILRLEWTEPSSMWKIDHYLIEYDSQSIRVDTRAWNIPITWQSKSFSVKAVDISGNIGQAGEYMSTITPPQITSFHLQVIDNNVLFQWEVSQGSLPVINTIGKKGDTWETAETIGYKKGTFTTVFESQSGDYRYWIAAVDSAGNVSDPVSKVAHVNQPPDYILNAKWDSDFSGTKTNAYSDGTQLILPVNTAETYEDHFTSRSWNSPQDQIDAGYPVYIEPFSATASYEETHDYGATIHATKITINVTKNIVGDTTPELDETCTISVSQDGSSWTDYPDVYQVYATEFRYVKVRLEWSGGTGDDGIIIENIETLLDSKLKNDSGRATVNASDANGTEVQFNVSFVDVDSITGTYKGSDPYTVVIDFQDTPNPTSFKIYLFDQNGSRKSGEVNWQARGF